MERRISDTKTKLAKNTAKVKKAAAKKVKEVKKEAPKKAKATIKKVETKALEEKKAIKEKVNDYVAAELNKVECVHCHKYFDKGLSICPYCRKGQKDQTGPIVITVLSVVLLLCIIVSYFSDKYSETKVDETTYKEECNLVSYEDLVRNAKDYKDKNVKVIGKVVKVTGTDVDYGNMMTITINADLFDGENKQLIEVTYTDKNYNQGFIAGDLITVYGDFTKINGNTPTIGAKYIVFGQ